MLAVGVRPGTAQGDALLAAAAQAGAAAVVFKTTPDLAELVRDRSPGVAVLAVPEEMTWTQLHALLSLSRFATATGAAGIAGVPLGDLFALANAIAGVVGGAVTIEDPARRVLAYSTLGDQPIDAARRGSILGRQVPDSPGMRMLYRQVLSTPGRHDHRRRHAAQDPRGRPAGDRRREGALGGRDPRGEPGDRVDLGHPRGRPARGRGASARSPTRPGSPCRT